MSSHAPRTTPIVYRPPTKGRRPHVARPALPAPLVALTLPLAASASDAAGIRKLGAAR